MYILLIKSVSVATFSKPFFFFVVYEASIELKPISEFSCSCVNSTKVKCEGYHKEFEGAFNFIADNNLPTITLPSDSVCISTVNGEQAHFTIKLNEPQLNNIRFDRRLHQHDGEEIFGTFEANITGYILDFITEHYEEKIYLDEPVIIVNEPPLTQTGVATGHIENTGSYKRTEYYYAEWDIRVKARVSGYTC